MSYNHRGGSNLAFNDLLFNVLIGFVMLFVIAFLLINPIAKEGDIPSKAEFLVTADWPDESDDDIDLWVQLPGFKSVGFSNKQQAPLHLARDDLGTSNDSINIDGQITILKINTETITMRGPWTGDVRVAIHGYSIKPLAKRTTELPVPVIITVTKVNPYRVIYKKTVYVERNGQAINLPGFSIDKEGKVTNIFKYDGKIVPRGPRP